MRPVAPMESVMEVNSRPPDPRPVAAVTPSPRPQPVGDESGRSRRPSRDRKDPQQEDRPAVVLDISGRDAAEGAAKTLDPAPPVRAPSLRIDLRA